MEKIHSIDWDSDETYPVLLPDEVKRLFNCTFELAKLGMLNNGKHKGANTVVYWNRRPTKDFGRYNC